MLNEGDKGWGVMGDPSVPEGVPFFPTSSFLLTFQPSGLWDFEGDRKLTELPTIQSVISECELADLPTTQSVVSECELCRFADVDYLCCYGGGSVHACYEIKL